MAVFRSNIIELCAFRIKDGQPLYLLLRRAGGEQMYPNIWQFITGSVKEKEKSVDAALRELSEETGLKPTSLFVVPYVLSFYNAEWDSMNLCPFFAAEVLSDAIVTISDEHDDFGWFTYDEAAGKLIWPAWKEGLRIVHEYLLGDGEAARLSRIS